MFKKLSILLFLIISIFLGTFFVGSNTSADSIKVENIFSDIDSNYKYLQELQTLYDKGMISPDINGKFNPRKLLNRDEFVGILMEVTCKDCIQPYTSNDLILKYEKSELFYDINKKNKYFYCIEDANFKGFVSGYGVGSTCIDGVYKEGTEGNTNKKRQFYPEKNISLEESIAVIMRASGILTKKESENIKKDICEGKITENIAIDVSPTNQGFINSFYGDLKKALNYEVKDIDEDGNEVIYHLIEKKGGKLRPKQAITKEEFLRIAYVTLKANSCGEKDGGDIALKMNIYDKSCSENSENCTISDLDDENHIYDFGNTVYTTCEKGIKDPEGYIWRFYNHNTGNQIIKYGKYLENYKFLSDGRWQVFLRVIDDCGNTGEVHSTINIVNNEDNGLGLEIDATPIYGNGPLDVDLTAKPEGGEGPYECSWDYGDGNIGNGIEVGHIFTNPGKYKVVTICKDKNGLESEVETSIYVSSDNNEDNGLGLEIDATPIYGNGPLDVDLTAKPEGGEGPYECSWDYGDGNIGNGIEVGHTFINPGKYKVVTICKDKNGLDAKATSVIYVIPSDIDLKVSIVADPIFGTGPLLVDLEGMVFGGIGPYSYFWNYGDGNTGYGKEVKNIFREEGIYEVKLIVTDSSGKQVTATVLIKVEGEDCNKDSDNDGINNCDDVLPLVPGDEKNKGAPILEKKCDIDSYCGEGYVCIVGKNICLPEQLSESCEYTGGDILFGNIICNSCPCNNTLDFTSTLRKCDIIFPAITSPDSTQIYGKGELFQIK